jgi:NADPH:quinone reductase-like Zn-dependent oxidoreductase
MSPSAGVDLVPGAERAWVRRSRSKRNKMKAAIRSRYGPPSVLSIQEVERPTPKDNEILIRVYAATVNRTDCHILSAKPFPMRFFTGLLKPRLSSTGTDFAGRIEAVGKYVSGFKVGDRIWGFRSFGIGSHAEYITLSENGPLTTIPDGISYEEAAASAEGAFYAYNFFKRIRVKAGDRALVNGATGAIGSAAVQLFKYFGAHVTAVGNTKNLELMKSLGADRVIDYMKEDFTQDDQKYHFIMDAVGKSSFSNCKSLLYPHGIYTSSGGAENFYLPLITRLGGNKRVVFGMPTDIKGGLTFIRSLLEKKQFRPLIDKRYPLEEIAEAFNYVASGQKTGNVILNLQDKR